MDDNNMKQIDQELYQVATNLIMSTKATCKCALDILETMKEPPYSRQEVELLSKTFGGLKRIFDQMLASS